MPTSPETPRPRRSKPKLTEEALASRLAATLDPKIVAETALEEPMPRRVAAEPMDMPSDLPAPPPKASAAPEPATAKTPIGGAVPQGTLFGAGVDRLTGAVSSAQEIARDTARSLADSRLVAAHSIVTFQKKLLEMVHANLNEGFAAAQKIVTAANVGEAIKVQSSFATTRVRALSDQAAELRSLSAKLAKEAQQPWAAQMAKSLDKMKSGLGA